MAAIQELVGLLADGRFHSGEQLAQHLGVSRAAVWKRLQRMARDTGLAVDAVRGRGYRLRAPLELLDAERLGSILSDRYGQVCDRHWVLSSVDSTNAFLARQPVPAPGRACVCLAEQQAAGRGRRGRQWASSYGSSILMSASWRFELPLAGLSALSLAVGVAVAEALSGLGLEGLGLKWPNDVQHAGRKLAGILVEASGETGGPALAIVGVGVNVRLADHLGESIDQPWTDLARAGYPTISRNALAEVLRVGILDACREYADRGIQPFLRRWSVFDQFVGRPVRLVGVGGQRDGRYLGLDSTGGLRLEGPDGVRTYHAGELSLREVSVGT
jgi:BirA family biotin operon repressor/biotin-[acetyl-CoA-carboxylase] ligase